MCVCGVCGRSVCVCVCVRDKVHAVMVVISQTDTSTAPDISGVNRVNLLSQKI